MAQSKESGSEPKELLGAILGSETITIRLYSKYKSLADEVGQAFAHPTIGLKENDSQNSEYIEKPKTYSFVYFVSHH